AWARRAEDTGVTGFHVEATPASPARRSREFGESIDAARRPRRRRRLYKKRSLPAPLKADAHVRLIAHVGNRVGVAQIPTHRKILPPRVSAGEVKAGVLPRLPDHAQLDAALLEEQAVVALQVLDMERLLPVFQRAVHRPLGRELVLQPGVEAIEQGPRDVQRDRR